MPLNGRGVGTVLVNGITFNIGPNADLRSANLRSANLRGALLSNANLENANLQSANLTNAILRSANLQSANLQGVNLRNTILEGANLEGANLTNSRLPEDLRGLNFRNANFSHATLTSTFLRDANLNGAILEGADLRRANLMDSNLQGANLQGADLREANLSHANLTNANLNNANLNNTNLTGANLRGVNLEHVLLDHANLAGVTFGDDDDDDDDDDEDDEDEEEENNYHPPQPIGLNIQNRQRQQLQRQQPQQPQRQTQGRAFEIHDAFHNLNKEQLLSILDIPNTSITNSPILEPLIQYISNSNISNKTELVNILNRIQTAITPTLNSPDNQELLLSLKKIVAYVLKQPLDFIELYVDNFTSDCLNAYDPGQQSCIKGMVERIIFAMRDVISTFCIENNNNPLCKPEYRQIFRVFYPDVEIDINKFFQDWFNEYSESGEVQAMRKRDRKKHFKDYVKNLIGESEYNRIQTQINNYIEQNDAIFDTLQLGGKNKTNKKHTRRSKKTRSRKTKSRKRKTKRCYKKHK